MGPNRIRILSIDQNYEEHKRRGRNEKEEEDVNEIEMDNEM